MRDTTLWTIYDVNLLSLSLAPRCFVCTCPTAPSTISLPSGGAAAGSKKGGKKGAAAAQQPAIVLDEGNRATYNTLKAQERQQTADTRQVRRWKYI